MAKEITKIIKLQINAGAANPSPPVGPALGQAEVIDETHQRNKLILVDVYMDKRCKLLPGALEVSI